MDDVKDKKRPWWLWLVLIGEVGAFILFAFVFKAENNLFVRELLMTIDSVSFGFTLTISITLNIDIKTKIFNIGGNVNYNEQIGNSKEDKLILSLEEHLKCTARIGQEMTILKYYRDHNMDTEVVDSKIRIIRLINEYVTQLAPIDGSVDKTPYTDSCVEEFRKYYRKALNCLKVLPNDAAQIFLSNARGINVYSDFDKSINAIIDFPVTLPPRNKN